MSAIPRPTFKVVVEFPAAAEAPFAGAAFAFDAPFTAGIILAADTAVAPTRKPRLPTWYGARAVGSAEFDDDAIWGSSMSHPLHISF